MFLIGLVAGILAVYAGTHWDTVIIPQIDQFIENLGGKSTL